MKNFNAGTYVSCGYYKSFHPNPINREWLLEDMHVISTLSTADRLLGEMNMYSQHIPNIDLFISMHVAKEATKSSKIEGTQTSMEETLLDREFVPLDRRDDWQEVQNYIAAMKDGIKMLEELPFSSRLIRNVHRQLLSGVRGEWKQPGEFRRSQNWIGGSNINDAVYVPPVHTEILDLMQDIEMFANNEELLLPELLRIALIHYQFETIHPFLDGNGRTGRLMITLYLVSKGILQKPILYLSDYLERHRNSYYTMLTKTRTENDLAPWFCFFLEGVIETSKHGIETFKKILALQEEYAEVAKSMGRKSGNVLIVILDMYRNPIIDASRISQLTGINTAAAYNLLNDLKKAGVLTEIESASRQKNYALKKYMDIFL